MTYKQQLTDLLCTEKSVDEQIKELKMGCKVILYENDWWDYWWKTHEMEDIIISQDWYTLWENDINDYNHIDDNGWYLWHSYYKIIWNPIEYHHLMMYCEEKDINMTLFHDWDMIRYFSKSIEDIEVTKLDNTKPLSEQSEEVYEKILIALNELNL